MGTCKAKVSAVNAAREARTLFLLPPQELYRSQPKLAEAADRVSPGIMGAAKLLVS